MNSLTPLYPQSHYQIISPKLVDFPHRFICNLIFIPKQTFTFFIIQKVYSWLCVQRESILHVYKYVTMQKLYGCYMHYTASEKICLTYVFEACSCI